MSAALKYVSTEDVAVVPANDVEPVATTLPARQRSLLRFITCGSVDDGKSTLLGRILYESGAVFEDQLEALRKDSRKFGTTGDDLDFALLLDGLSAEREQGITVDVAYRYFSTPDRAFIAADTPGHEQYTRNMATGASTADVAIILVDARKGLLPQTRRHSYIVSMLGVRQVLVAVNKMDLVGYDEGAFRAIERDYRALAAELGFSEVHVVPLSARSGENVVTRAASMGWYAGKPLLPLLESIQPVAGGDSRFRLPVQWVNRPNLDFRGYAGMIASGTVRVGDRVTVQPRGQTSTVASILGPKGEVASAGAGESVTVTLAGEIDVSRGDVLAPADGREQAIRGLKARLLVLGETPVAPGKTYVARRGAATVSARLKAIAHRIDIHDYSPGEAQALESNAIGRIELTFDSPVLATRYRDCRETGSFLLIDPVTNETAALGVVDELEARGTAVPAGGQRKALDSLRDFLVRRGMVVASAGPMDIARALADPVVAAVPVAAIGGIATGSIAIAGLLGAADLALRPLARSGHAAFWRRIAIRRAGRSSDTFGIDGGGI